MSEIKKAVTCISAITFLVCLSGCFASKKQAANANGISSQWIDANLPHAAK